MHQPIQEVERIRNVYAKRDTLGKQQLYGWNQPDEQLSLYLLRVAVTKALTKASFNDLAEIDCLDVGCGNGAWLRVLMEWGANPSRLHGIDLLSDRIEKARLISPQIDFSVSTGGPLPFNDSSMDFVSAYTVFSSILDPEVRATLAKEMMRIIRPSGILLIYDFRVSDPRNRDTVGIGGKEIKKLFPGMQVRFKSISLAPPIQRPLARFSPLFAHMVEVFIPMLRTHMLCTLKKESHPS